MIKIIRATLDNLKEIQQIGRQTFLETFSQNNTETNMEKYLKESFNDNKIMAELNNQNSQFFIVKDSDMTIGYLKINFNEAQTELQDSLGMEIERIYVIGGYHGKNIGQLLYEKAVRVAQVHDINYVWLGVWEQNAKAIKFYSKNGFVEFGKHIFKLGNNKQTDIMMKKILFEPRGPTFLP